SGNRDDGLDFRNGADGNLVQGNLIGTNAAGTQDLGNTDEGLQIDTMANTIGGLSASTAGARNIISGNDSNGVQLRATGNLLQGNFIGTDISGAQPVRNTLNGVSIENASDNTIGGTSF